MSRVNPNDSFEAGIADESLGLFEVEIADESAVIYNSSHSGGSCGGNSGGCSGGGGNCGSASSGNCGGGGSCRAYPSDDLPVSKVLRLA